MSFLSFILGISITINICLIGIIFFYIKFKEKKEFLNDEAIVDKDMAKSFLDL